MLMRSLRSVPRTSSNQVPPPTTGTLSAITPMVPGRGQYVQGAGRAGRIGAVRLRRSVLDGDGAHTPRSARGLVATATTNTAAPASPDTSSHARQRTGVEGRTVRRVGHPDERRELSVDAADGRHRSPDV